MITKIKPIPLEIHNAYVNIINLSLMTLLEVHHEYINVLNAIYYFSRKDYKTSYIETQGHYWEGKKKEFKYYISWTKINSPWDRELQPISEIYEGIQNRKLREEKSSIELLTNILSINEKTFSETFPTARDRIYLRHWFKNKIIERNINIDLDNLM